MNELPLLERLATYEDERYTTLEDENTAPVEMAQ